MKIPFGKPIIGPEEKEVINQVLDSPMLVHGPRAKEFEQAFAEFTGAPHAVSLASCTAGLHLAYLYLGLGPGDEVLVPAQTHVATAHSVEYCGAKPIFIDAEIHTGNVNLQLIENAITPNTKAIAIVHYLGLPVDMREICRLAEKHKLFVVEDCALGVGSYLENTHVGLFGDVGCYSFYPVKHITTAEGGMLITKHEQIAEKIARQKAFGLDRTVGERTVPGVYDVTMLGYNYRMNELEAALGIEQLKKAPEFLRIRKENYNTLQSGLAEVEELTLFETSKGDFESSYYCLSVVLSEALKEKRFELMSYLKEREVGTSVYYPKPVPHFSYYKEKYGHLEDSFPVASQISYASVALPVGPHLNTKDMGYIVDEIKKGIVKVLS